MYHSAEEEQFRKKVVDENIKFILDSNQQYYNGHRKFKLEMNNFTDYTDEEFHQLLSRPIHADRPVNVEVHYAPKDFDADSGAEWGPGVVSPVKNQGKCASGWAFSAVAAMEGAHILYRNLHFIALSEQNLIDCSTAQGNNGCEMGSADFAFEVSLEPFSAHFNHKSYSIHRTLSQTMELNRKSLIHTKA